MRYSLILIVAFVFFAASELAAQETNPSSGKSISLHLPQGVSMEGLRINYFISGSFGGVRSFVRIEDDVGRYEIPLTYESKRVEKMRLIIFSPKYQLQVFDFPSIAEMPKNIKLKFEPLETIPFAGRVLLPNQFDSNDLQIRVKYTPQWECEFFQLKDCMLALLPITSVNLEKDGSFKVNLPDFAGDSTISSFKDKGAFSFEVEEKIGKRLFRLVLKDGPKSSEVKTALAYPVEKVFTPEEYVISEENFILSSKAVKILLDLIILCLA